MSDLEIYKSTEIARLKAQNQRDVKEATDKYVAAVQIINKKKLSAVAKRGLILAEQGKLKATVNALNTKLKRDIAEVSSLTSIPGTIEASTAPTPAPTQVPTPVRCALLIGINYRGTQYQLYGCINDVYNMEKYLRTKRRFTNVDIVTDDTVKKPTRDTILSQLKSLVASAVAGDTLFFQYSGHGTQTPDKSGEEADGLDEQIVPIDFKCITDDEIRSILASAKAGVTIVALLDSCHSGTAIDLKYQYLEDDVPLTLENNMSDMAANVILISGCKDNQTSADAYIGGVNQGAMTWSFLSSMANPGTSTWRQLLSNMRQALKSGGYTQIPQLSCGRPLDIDSGICI